MYFPQPNPSGPPQHSGPATSGNASYGSQATATSAPPRIYPHPNVVPANYQQGQAIRGNMHQYHHNPQIQYPNGQISQMVPIIPLSHVNQMQQINSSQQMPHHQPPHTVQIYPFSYATHMPLANQSHHPNGKPSVVVVGDTGSQPIYTTDAAIQERYTQEQKMLEKQSQQRGAPAQVWREDFFNGDDVDVSNVYHPINEPAEPACPTFDSQTKEFINFFDAGCEIAEKVSIRNQHRWCFRNIHNLCFRTRTEINRPSNVTTEQISAYGVPYATKDFIYAYVRLINCWHIIKGYLQVSDGSLGNLDHEFTGDLRACFAKWEDNSRELAEHIIRVFTNLDSNVSNPAPLPAFLNRNRKTQTSEQPKLSKTSNPTKPTNTAKDAPRPTLRISDITKKMSLDDIKPFVPAIKVTNPTVASPESVSEYSTACSSPVQTAEQMANPESTNNSNHSTVKKYSTDQNCPAFEFYPSTKNIDKHYMKLAQMMQGDQDPDFEKVIAACNSLTSPVQYLDEATNGYPDEAPQFQYEDLEPIETPPRPPQYQNEFHENLEAAAILPQPEENLRNERYQQVPIQAGLIGPPQGCKKKSRLDYELDSMGKLLAEIQKTDLFRKTAPPTRKGPMAMATNLWTIIEKSKLEAYTCAEDIVDDIDSITNNAKYFYKNDPEKIQEINRFVQYMAEYCRRHRLNLSFEDNGRFIEE